jgi:hypothetical protein
MKPEQEWFSCTVKNSPGGNGYLMPAFRAFSNFPVIKVILRAVTLGTTKSIGPAQRKKIIPAIIIRFEPG